jgi:hypothetical protein
LVASRTTGTAAPHGERVHPVMIETRGRWSLKNMRRLRPAIHIRGMELLVQEARWTLLQSHLLLLLLLCLRLTHRADALTLTLIVCLTVWNVRERNLLGWLRHSDLQLWPERLGRFSLALHESHEKFRVVGRLGAVLTPTVASLAG